MSTTRGDRFFRAVERDLPAGGGAQIETRGRPIAEVVPVPNETPNPLQKALDDYHFMGRELRQAQERARATAAENQGLLAEVNMLREAYERADGDRIRLQAIASTLLGRLLAINDVIGGAVKASIREGIEASHAAKAEDELAKYRGEPATVDEAIEQRMETARAEAAEPAQRAAPIIPAVVAPPGPPAPVGSPVIPEVDWSKPPQGKAG